MLTLLTHVLSARAPEDARAREDVLGRMHQWL